MSLSTAAALPFGLGEDQLELASMCREFADEQIAPHALEWDANHHFPVDAIKASAALGLGGVYASEEYGGSALGRMDAAVVFENIATGCPAVAAYISIHNMATWMVDKYGTEEQKQQWLTRLTTFDALASYCLTEPGAGSDAAAITTTARRDGEYYVLNGTKQFISGAGETDVYLLMARTGQAGSHGISSFLIDRDTPGLSFGANEAKMGWRAQPTRQVFLENARVPAANMLGSEGEGFKIAMSGLDGGRLNIGACAIGGAQKALETAVSYLGERQAFGDYLNEFQALRFEVAGMQADLEGARSLLWRAAQAYDAEDSNTSLLSAMAKLKSTDVAFDVANRALQLLGGYGYLHEYGIEKIVRDLRVHQILEGTNEIMKVIISRKSTGVG